MENAFKKAVLKSDKPSHEIIESIREVCRQIDYVNTRFSMESDSDLIEACIYELEALRSRYRYLLKIAKLQGISADEEAVSK